MTTAPHWRGVGVLSCAHVVDDFYQGAVPALLPFLAVAYGFSNSAIAGLALASTVFSAVAQPLLGWWSDRKSRVWMIWVGMCAAALGIAACGLLTDYALIWIALALSGLGVAAFHPEGARVARSLSGSGTLAMSVYALAGNVGYAVGAVLVALILAWAGLGSTVVLVIPAAVMAVVLIRSLPNSTRTAQRRSRSARLGANDWPAFLTLSTGVVIRSIVFSAITSFAALFLMERFGLQLDLAAIASSAFLGAGIVGTLLGGLLADRIGRLTSQRLGLVLSVPALAGIVFAPNPPIAFLCIVLLGVALYIPFPVMVTLGQDYLPRNVGIASGVTLGLAVSIGGLFSPIIGWIADLVGLQLALAGLIPLPLVAIVLIWRLKEPRPPGAEPVTEPQRVSGSCPPGVRPRERPHSPEA